MYGEAYFFDVTGKRWHKVRMIVFSFFLFIGMFMLVVEFNRQQIFNLPFIDMIFTSLLDGVIKIFCFYLILAIIIGFVRLFILVFFNKLEPMY